MKILVIVIQHVMKRYKWFEKVCQEKSRCYTNDFRGL